MEVKVDLKEFMVLRNTHIGPLGRELRRGDVLQWILTTKYLAVNGVQVDHKVDVVEVMRVLVKMGEKDPIITPVDFKKSEAPKSELKTINMNLWQVLHSCNTLTRALPGFSPLVKEAHSNFMSLFSYFSDDIDEKLMGLSCVLLDEETPNITVHETQAFPDIDWLFPNRSTRIGDFAGIAVNKGFSISVAKHIHEHPVVRVAAKNGITVCLSVVDCSPEKCYDFIPLIDRLTKVKTPSSEWNGVSFPVVDFFTEETLSILVGLKYKSSYHEKTIEKAVSYCKFSLSPNNKHGMYDTVSGVNYIIDRPFLLWIEKGGLTIPLFAAVFCEDKWKS